LVSMGRAVFGLGLAQVMVTLALATGIALAIGASWQAGLALGGILAMSSTAIVSKLLADRMELETPHGRQVMGVLLFQDLAVVPLLVLIPALGGEAGAIGMAIGVALVKAALALGVLLVAGPRLMREWLGIVARRRSNELFVLNVLLVTLLLAFVTSLAGLSLVLGAFLAGMLISETEYRFRVEEDIQPFRDVLLGLFFVSVGMALDLQLVLGNWPLVLLFFILVTFVKLALIAGLAFAFSNPAGTALRVAIALAQGGEFGLVLLTLAAPVVPPEALQAVLGATLLSMLTSPFLIAASDRIVLRLARSEWMLRSLELHRVAAQAIDAEGHVIILGYGRNGQRLARLLEAEGVRYVALDLDPDRVREAALAGDSVVLADSSRREALSAAGISRAGAAVVTYADAAAAIRVLAHIHELNPALPVVVRARDESDIERLMAAGASEVVPEAFESGVMLASHTLVWVGIPLSRVMRRMSQVRGERYGLLRGLFHGAGERSEADGQALVRLRSITLDVHARSLGNTLAQMGLEELGVQVSAVRRRGVRSKLSSEAAGALQAGDVVVLLGSPGAIAAAEDRLLRSRR
ncbi:MAG TPA: cation:proton antiporter, partial [Burkholderiales bacterium]|nr:cation:proton antiporter [Burkholderiales bacterium]